MVLKNSEIKQLIISYKKEHAPPISKLRRHELIRFAMTHNLLKEGDLSRNDLEVFLETREPSKKSKTKPQEPKTQEPKTQEPKPREPNPQLIPGGGRKSERNQKNEEKIEIDSFKRKINNFITYWKDEWKSLPTTEKLNAYNDIYLILDAKDYKKGFVYDALKQEIERFTIPDYALRGYTLWLKSGKKYNKFPSSRLTKGKGGIY